MKAFFTLLFALCISTLFAQTRVKGYFRNDGTYVAPRYSASQYRTKNDRYNINPSAVTTGTPYSGIDASYEKWDNFTVGAFYSKVELPAGSISANGEPISYVFVETDPPKIGKYNVSISGSEGDLFKVDGTHYYIRFRTHQGSSGHAEEGVLDVRSSGDAVYYKQP